MASFVRHLKLQIENCKLQIDGAAAARTSVLIVSQQAQRTERGRAGSAESLLRPGKPAGGDVAETRRRRPMVPTRTRIRPDAHRRGS